MDVAIGVIGAIMIAVIIVLGTLVQTHYQAKKEKEEHDKRKEIHQMKRDIEQLKRYEADRKRN